MSSPQGRRTGLIVVLIVVPVLVLGALVAGGAYVMVNLWSASSVPAGCPTAGFVVTTPDRSSPSQEIREQVGQLLVGRAGGGARYEVRPHGVRIGVPVAERVSLERLRALSPISTDVEFRPVLEETPSSGPTASPSPGAAVSEELPSLDGKSRYRLGPVAMTGTRIESTKVEAAANGWQITMSLDSAGDQQFTTLTAELVGKQLAIVVAGAVVSAPEIQQAITGGQVQISGSFTRTQATGLDAAFKLGQRPVTVAVGEAG